MKEMTMSVIVRLVIVSFNVLLAAAAAWAQAPPPGTAPAWAQTTSPGLQGFGIVLVLGDMQDGGTSDSVPPGARAALADLKDFLPYRSYRVLDTNWVLASSPTQRSVSTRLQGSDEQSYEIELDRMATGPSSLQVRFAMREPSANADQRSADREALLRRQLADSVEHLQRAQAAQNRAEIEAARKRVIEIEFERDRVQKQARYSPGGGTLIDTSFTMSLGETVVVGTSRMRGGNQALIVLLTAATRGAKPRE
jgi:hypothetical protein